jgi:hypothetical protein
VALIETYFDESYDDDTLCVAGYIFTKLRSRNLTRQWKQMLRTYRLPYFRMSACAHGNEPFDNLTGTQCINAEKEAIRIIKKCAVLGVAVSVDVKQFEKLLADDEIIETPYQFCVWFCRQGVQIWADENNIGGI